MEDDSRSSGDPAGSLGAPPLSSGDVVDVVGRAGALVVRRSVVVGCSADGDADRGSTRPGVLQPMSVAAPTTANATPT
ncbi:MAG: hypothetical protein IPG46_17445 [Actinobacteria bacterium]|nr:hypothetical protein [Actinomycetota bacterium]